LPAGGCSAGPNEGSVWRVISRSNEGAGLRHRAHCIVARAATISILAKQLSVFQFLKNLRGTAP
jgi:hypothetical protein